ncbi:hypothetical protein B9Z19DRAFT_1068074 [Tuber borchii]|uniref:DUF4360 domain-containing protein n=1 Tax=Tuber borchii TaxID=42251 RepID=A0A2T6ZGH9_TUBBO|nr:hypothetical protein B9Z19DRAFT_1068074 [Tuber borchii]
MKYSVSAIVLGFFAAFGAATPTPDDKPDDDQVIVTGVTYAGSGCKAGTAHISNSPDWSTFTIIFDDFNPTIGPGSKISDQVKNCNLNFQANYPPGYQYAIYKTDYTGYALLDAGVTVKQTSSYWFAGFVSDRPTFQSTWYGPYNNQYHFTDTLQSALYSPCGNSTSLNINTQIFMTSSNPKAHGSINPPSELDTLLATSKIQHAYYVNWRRCN